ncbi:GDP-mannose 4,6-dehydratase [Sphingosinicellaceae bacterium]|nr:GDP-mannose 4,6-dehydratase [Sphingosinicellaceae bacterium]
MKTALVCGIGGQDGGYLAALLLERGYRVVGTSRDAHMNPFRQLEALGIRDRVTLMSMAPDDYRSVITAVTRAEPDEIYALAGQSSVGLSFELPAETLTSAVFGVLNMLEAIRHTGRPIRLYHASSSEAFGDLAGIPATETTPFRPRSPYGVAKASAHMLVANYREAYGLFACNGILFNHESPARPQRFVTAKIAAAARRIATGSTAPLNLGRLDIVRDWGWAPEFVEAMWLMLQQDVADDYIVATGQSHSLEEFVAAAFAAVGLDWRAHVVIDAGLGRPTDLGWSGADPGHALARLGWQARTTMPEVARRMVLDTLV